MEIQKPNPATILAMQNYFTTYRNGYATEQEYRSCPVYKCVHMYENAIKQAKLQFETNKEVEEKLVREKSKLERKLLKTNQLYQNVSAFTNLNRTAVTESFRSL